MWGNGKQMNHSLYQTPSWVPLYQMCTTTSCCCGSGQGICFQMDLKRAAQFWQRLKKHPLLSPECILRFLSAYRHTTRWLLHVFCVGWSIGYSPCSGCCCRLQKNISFSLWLSRLLAPKVPMVIQHRAKAVACANFMFPHF